MKDIKI